MSTLDDFFQIVYKSILKILHFSFLLTFPFFTEAIAQELMYSFTAVPDSTLFNVVSVYCTKQ